MKNAARSMLRSAFFVGLFGVVPVTLVRADEPTTVPAGEVRLASGRVVDYMIHFDRNSLRGSVRIGSDLVALTSSGTLLRFELPAVRLVRQRIGTEEVTCIGRGEGDALLAGLSDGRVCRVDVATLELTDVIKLPSAAQWIGWSKAAGDRPAGLVVVALQMKPVVRNGRTWNERQSVVHDLGTGKTIALYDTASTFLLDRAGRLWLGADRGEWGGQVWRVELSHGTVSEVKPPPSREARKPASWDGVYGFIELRDGQVWAFGGTSHLGLSSGYITRVDEGAPRPLFAVEFAVEKP